jgi:hypothetical protein
VGYRHKVFVSYHHANDQSYKNIFELRFGNAADILVPHSVGLDEFRMGPEVTVSRVLRSPSALMLTRRHSPSNWLPRSLRGKRQHQPARCCLMTIAALIFPD